MAENIPTNQIRPKKETVRINLPPKPTVTPEIKLPPLKPPENPVKKTGNYTTPEGIEEFYDENGILEVRVFPDDAQESYDKTGKVTKRTDREGKGLPIDTPVSALESEKRKLFQYWDKLSSGTKKAVQFVTAATLLGGGYVGGKKLGWWEGHTPAEGITQRHTTTEPGQTNIVKMPPDVNMTEEASKAKKKKAVEEKRADNETPPPAPVVEKRPTYDRYDQSFESKSTLTKKPTPEEIKKEIEKKIEKKIEEPAPKERSSVSETDMTQKPPEKIKEQVQINERNIGFVRPYDQPHIPFNGTEGGFVTPYGATSYGPPVNFGNFAPPGLSTENPLRLSDKMLEKVEEIYENNIEIIFPNDTLRTWKKVQNKSAYELINTPESKVSRAHRSLLSHLKNLEETTGLKPRSGVRGGTESVGKYIERALQKAAQEGRIDELKLK